MRQRWVALVVLTAALILLLIGGMIGATTMLVIGTEQGVEYTEREILHLAALEVVAVQSVEVGEKWMDLATLLAEAFADPTEEIERRQ